MKKILIALVLAIAMMSCTTASFSGLQVTTNLPSHDIVGNFDVTISIAELLGVPGGPNLLNITASAMDPAVTSAIQSEIIALGGDAAIDVVIVQQATFMDIVLTGITGSIYSPVHYNISGTVIKW